MTNYNKCRECYKEKCGLCGTRVIYNLEYPFLKLSEFLNEKRMRKGIEAHFNPEVSY
jgi:hypothetical protein